VDSKRLKAFSDEHSQAWIYPQQQQARRFRGSISRGVGLEHVEIRLIDDDFEQIIQVATITSLWAIFYLSRISEVPHCGSRSLITT